MKKTIFVDMDNTLNRLWEPFTDQLSMILNRDVRLERDQLKHYTITDNFSDLSEKLGHKYRNDIFSTPGFWENIPVQENAVKVMAELIEKYQIYILTKPWIYANNCVPEKLQWVKNHFPFFDLNKVIFTGQKHLINGDFFIDDAPLYMEEMTGKVVAMDYPYNQNYTVHKRVHDWKQIGQFFDVWN